MKIPLLIISDAPSCNSGLGRICKDIALGVHHSMSDLYEVATFGYGGPGDRRLPFMQYQIEGMHDFFLPTIREVWENFAQGRKGAVLTIWDPSRMLWFARPDSPIWLHDREMKKWLLSKPFHKWIYAPMDASGPNDQLCQENAECLYGFDRIIAYSEWAKKIIENTFSTKDCASRALTAIPHGIHTNTFFPHLESNRRSVFRADMGFEGPVFEDYEKIIGIVATNQTRKDYGMAIAALAEVAKDTPIRLFIQVDDLHRHWSIPRLLVDYNLIHKSIVNLGIVSDEVMAKMYSACDLTLGIGPEGFGFPIFESLACGTPVLAGNLGGHAEHMDQQYLIPPQAYRAEGSHNSIRPVYDPKKWAWKIKKILSRQDEQVNRFKLRESLLAQRLDWKNLWPNEWEPWFREAHRTLEAQEPFLYSPSNSPEMDTAPGDRHTSIIASPEVPAV